MELTAGTMAAWQPPDGQNSNQTNQMAAHGGAGSSAVSVGGYPAWQTHYPDYPEQLNSVLTLSHNGASQQELDAALMKCAPAVQGVAIHNLSMYVCLHRPHALIVLRCRGHNTMLHQETREHFTNSHERITLIRDAIFDYIHDSDTNEDATVESAFANEWQYAKSTGRDEKSENRRNEV